jgi:hypothetical protein
MGLQLPGDTTSAVRIPHGSDVVITGLAITIAGWLKNDSGSGANLAKSGQYGLYNNGSSLRSFYSGELWLGGVGSDFYISTTNVWNHVAVTFDGTTIKYYTNGNLVLSRAAQGDGNIVSKSTPVVMGCSVDTNPTS